MEVAGRKYELGMSLERLLQRLGGYEGTLRNPSTGNDVSVSLEEWRTRDPRTVWLEVEFISSDD